MAKFTVTGFIFILEILSAVAEGHSYITTDITPKIYCNKRNRTWNDALKDCMNVNGRLVAYETGLGKNVAEIYLDSEADVWTADYALEQTRSDIYGMMCGFKFLTKDKFDPQVMYGECTTMRNYICKTVTTKRLVILNGTYKEASTCRTTITRNDLSRIKNNIVHGFYWTNDTLLLSTDTSTTELPSQAPFLCGAYKADIGRYYVGCTTKRPSLCRMNTSFVNDTFDKSCFVNRNASSTVKTASYSTRSPNGLLTVTAQSTVRHTPAFLKTVATPVENIETSSAKAVPKTVTVPTHTVILNRWMTVSDDRKEEKQTENDSNLGVTIGLPVGLCIALICGIILSIYILRRYKFRKTKNRKSGPNEAISLNNVSSTGKEITRFNKNSVRTTTQILDQKKTNDESTRKYENDFKETGPEYAVVHKHSTENQKANSPQKEKEHEPVYKSDLDRSSSYSYARVVNKDNFNQLANSTGIQSSEYSFAKETTRENEYDVTTNVPSYKTADNIDNKLQGDNYYSSTDVKRVSNTGNIYNISQNQVSETLYDSAKQIDYPGQTDNIYNHTFQTETYGDVSMRNVQTKLNDQTYDKLK